MERSKGECFFVTRIGAEGSPERQHADGVLTAIVEPAVGEIGFSVVRADQIAEPGQITTQVIDYLLNAEIVVADVTGGNPNVYYELGVRHTLRKPVVLLAEEGETLPFDTSQMRTIFYAANNLVSAGEARRLLIEHMRNALQSAPDSPVTTAVDLQSLRSGGPVERQIADLVQTVQALSRDIQESHTIGTRSQGHVSRAALADLQAVTIALEEQVDDEPPVFEIEYWATILRRVNDYLQERLGNASFDNFSLTTRRPRTRSDNFGVSYEIKGGRVYISLDVIRATNQAFVCRVTRPDQTSATATATRPTPVTDSPMFSQRVFVTYPDDFDATQNLPSGRYLIEWHAGGTRMLRERAIATSTFWISQDLSR